jgi:monoamine oxidase
LPVDLGERVTTMAYDGQKHQLVRVTTDCDVYTGDTIIVTAPLGVLKAGELWPYHQVDMDA